METSVPFGGKRYVYFPEGIPYYSLYRTKRKINSFYELEHIAEKFRYLNPDFDEGLMVDLFVKLSDRESGHIIRTYDQDRVTRMVYSVLKKKKTPYMRNKRKIVFNPVKYISKEDKREIVGKLIGRKPLIAEEDLKFIVSDLYENRERITLTKIAELTDTSRYIVKKSISAKMWRDIVNLNEKIKEEKNISKIIEAIEILTSKGNRLKMRKLKEITSIRDYEVLKKAVTLYQNGF
jgi:hypothetical protein